MRFIIISGLSGSGKSIALNTLEDLGFYCVDNLPLGLIRAFAKEISQEQFIADDYAIGIDARNQTALFQQFPTIVDDLKKMDMDVEIFYLQAEHNTLLKRFSETRRKHPLSNDERSLEEAIKLERQMLNPVVSEANLIIDTSATSIYQLRELIKQRVGRKDHFLSVLIQSFGFKHGLPADADIVFDVRCLPNPYWEANLRPFNGTDEPVITFLNEQEEFHDMVNDISDYAKRWIPKFRDQYRNYLTIAIGCTGGQHRSVCVAEHVAEKLKEDYDHITVRHRELS